MNSKPLSYSQLTEPPSREAFKPKLLVIIDSALEDYSLLVAGVIPTAQVLVLDSQGNGVQQISDILTTETEIEQLHILCHGSPGCLYLGNSIVNLGTLGKYASEFKKWRKALGVGSQVILYGCEVAAQKVGRKFVNTLHQVLGSNLAATDSLTGNKQRGGSWNLGVNIGGISASPVSPVLSTEVMATYGGVLHYNLAWAQNIELSAWYFSKGMATDSAGNVYATGGFDGSIDTNRDGIADLVSAGGTNAYIAKFNGDGALVWAPSIGGSGFGLGNDIAVDAAGNVYVTGSFDGSIDTNRDGIADLVSAGSLDAYIAKFNDDGALVWAQSIGGSDGGSGNGIAVDAAGNVYATGDFLGSIDINEDGTADLVSTGSMNTINTYIIKFETAAPDSVVPIRGTAGNDILTGTWDVDLLLGLDGHDTINGLDGDDTLMGGFGHDYLDGGPGNDSLVGGGAGDTLIGGAGNDILIGGAGQDILTSGLGADVFVFGFGESGVL